MLPVIKTSEGYCESRNRYRGDSIIFHSRSVYLKSRCGRRPDKLNHNLPPLFRPSQSSGKDRLMPPSQLQTRYKAQRYTFSSKDPKQSIKPLHGLMKQEDTFFTKRKTEILKRMRESEQKANRDKVAQYQDQDQVAHSPLHEASDCSENEVEITMRDHHSNSHRRSSILRQQLKERRKSSLIASLVLSSKSGKNNVKDDEPYPEAFSFLEDWKRESRFQPNI